jgi:hypothetical protein
MLHFESPFAERDIDFLFKNQNAAVHRMRSQGQMVLQATGIAGQGQP